MLLLQSIASNEIIITVMGSNRGGGGGGQAEALVSPCKIKLYKEPFCYIFRLLRDLFLIFATFFLITGGLFSDPCGEPFLGLPHPPPPYENFCGRQ